MEIWLKFLNLMFQSQHAKAGNPSINLRNLRRSIYQFWPANDVVSFDRVRIDRYFLCISSIQGGCLPDISGVIIPISRLIAPATHAFLQGVLTPSIAGRGPPCTVYRIVVVHTISEGGWIIYIYGKKIKHKYTSSSRASRGRKFQKKKEPYSRERICL